MRNKNKKHVKLVVFIIWFSLLFVEGMLKMKGGPISWVVLVQYLTVLFWYVYNLYHTSVLVNIKYPELQEYYSGSAKWGDLKIVNALIVNYQIKFSIEDNMLKELVRDLNMSIRMVLTTFVLTVVLLLF